MAKGILFEREAREKLVKGINLVARAVGSTIGPKGQNVAIGSSYGAPTVTNDGVTVANAIESQDPYIQMGVQLVKQAASKTNDQAGDGTTTATVLTQSIVNEGFKHLTAGTDGISLKKGIDFAVNVVVEELKKNSRPVTNKEAIKNIATISAGDPAVGELISEVMDKVGSNGVVTVEEGNKMGLYTEYTDGMSFDRGYISQYLITQSEGMIAEYKNPKILITDKKISSIQQIIGLLEAVAKDGKKELVIIAEDVDGEALATIIINKLKGTFNILAVKAPAFGDRRKAILQDIAILTGATVITEELGLKLETATIDQLGTARTIRSTKENTVVVVDQTESVKQKVEERVAQIETEIKNTTSDYDKEKLNERKAKLTGGVGVIKIGAATEVEMKEKKLRVEDALNATKAAVEEGIVSGGGTALIHALSAIKDLKAQTPDQQAGVEIVKLALASPLKLIAENAGAPSEVIFDAINRESLSGNKSFGFDASTNTFGDMFEKGIIDPLKVARLALQNASSVAGMVLTVNTIIADLPKEEKELGHSHNHGMDDDMGMGY